MEACWAHNPEVRRSKLRSARNILCQHDPLAQRIARWTSNPKVLGSIPRWVGKLYFDFVLPHVYYAVRMAEWSKAPDSRCTPCFAIQSKLVRILVLDEGMGSNPISDKNLFFNVQK